jgi:hypothetical protein
MDGQMKVLKLAVVLVVFVTGCGGDNKDVSECPEITLPVIIPAVNVKFFEANELALNVCDAILTVNRA